MKKLLAQAGRLALHLRRTAASAGFQVSSHPLHPFHVLRQIP
jgi:hypothetical protein